MLCMPPSPCSSTFTRKYINAHRFPLLHFVLDNLPSSTKAPELDDTNTVISLRHDKDWTGEDWTAGAGVSVEQMGIYLAYLVALGFLPAPQGKGEIALPHAELSERAKKSLGTVGGRGAMV